MIPREFIELCKIRHVVYSSSLKKTSFFLKSSKYVRIIKAYNGKKNILRKYLSIEITNKHKKIHLKCVYVNYTNVEGETPYIMSIRCRRLKPK